MSLSKKKLLITFIKIQHSYSFSILCNSNNKHQLHFFNLSLYKQKEVY